MGLCGQRGSPARSVSRHPVDGNGMYLIYSVSAEQLTLILILM